jgi:cytidylate kinase
VSLANTIAIDGPAAVGKTVVGRLLAHRLGYRFLDTGVMYRAIALGAIRRSVKTDDADLLARLVRELFVDVVSNFARERVLLNGEDVTWLLHTSVVDEASSQVARIPRVREALVARQRAMAIEGDMVMMGRDIGTVVLPQAGLKVFLQASTAERVRRRHAELQQNGRPVDLAIVERELNERDLRDIQRSDSPLRPAREAHLVQTDGATVDEVVERIIDLLKGTRS